MIRRIQCYSQKIEPSSCAMSSLAVCRESARYLIGEVEGLHFRASESVKSLPGTRSLELRTLLMKVQFVGDS